MDMIRNRLEKNFKKLKAWVDRQKIEAYRLYDRDIPEYPFIVDVYAHHYLIYDKSDPIKDQNKNHLPHVITALKTLFSAPEANIIVKKRERQEGLSQYEKLAAKGETMIVQEGPARFIVNLYDYLDTGLFLDHRPMRQKIYKLAAGKNFLNLFCYTGSVSVYAAIGGATTTSVDMSQTYLNWAENNFKLNGLELDKHQFVAENALKYLETNAGKPIFDLIFLDPPTFSNSKRMESDFEVEKDQVFLVKSCMSMLKPSGILFFSNNKRKFHLSEEISAQFKVRDISKETIPQDFHDQKIHHCFQIEEN